MLLSLATPNHIQILLQLLMILNPADQLTMIKILSSLHSNQLPRELFDDAARPLLENLLSDQDTPKLCLIEKLGGLGNNLYSYAKLLYTMAARIRLYLGLSQTLEDHTPYHSVSRQLLRLLLKVVHTSENAALKNNAEEN